MLNELAHLPANVERQRTRRSLVVALVVSIALHAALLGLAPGFVEERQPAVKLGALEVILRVPAEPLPVAAPEPASQPAQPEPAPQPVQPTPEQPEAASAAAQSRARPGPGIALPVPSDARADPDRSFVVAPARSSDPLPAVPEQRAPAAEAQVTLASFSAAYLNNPAPRYPDAARRLGQEGTVTLRVLVTVDGMPARVDLEQSSGSPHLDGAALERVRNWRFKPAWQGSVPVESWVIVPIVFRLEGAS